MMWAVANLTSPPGGLLDQQRRPRPLQLAGNLDWYLVSAGRFQRVGSGDVSEADLGAVHRELGAGAVFVCVAKPAPLEAYLPKSRTATKRISRSSRQSQLQQPKLRWVARGARLAVLPDLGAVWVDDEHLFKAGETVPLPWTDPPVALVVVRPATVFAAMKAVLGTKGPRRAAPPDEAG